VFRLLCSAARAARAATTPQAGHVVVPEARRVVVREARRVVVPEARRVVVPEARHVTAGAAVAAALVLGAAACGGGATAQDTAVGNGSSFVSGGYNSTLFKSGSRPAAPGVRGTTLTGAKWQLSADRGNVVVLNFWGSWCTPCREEAPALGALAQHFARSDVRFVGVDIRDDPASAEAFMRRFRISYPSLNDPNDQVALDFSGTAPPAAIPSTLVIDRSGRIAARVIGQVSYNGLKALITQISAERT
jgi:thiol-disulfide isomerase/thioredoxin